MIFVGRGKFPPYNKISACGSGMRSFSPGRSSFGLVNDASAPSSTVSSSMVNIPPGDLPQYQSLQACNQDCENQYGPNDANNRNAIEPQYGNCTSYCKSLFPGGTEADYNLYTPDGNEILDGNGNPVSFGPAGPTQQQFAAMNPAVKAVIQKKYTPAQLQRAGIQAASTATDWKTIGLPVAAGFAGLLLIVAFLGQASKVGAGDGTA